MEENKNKNSVISFFNDWGLLILSIAIIVAYIVFSAIPQKLEATNIWTNIIFTVLNLLAAFYIARKVSIWGWQTDNAKSQKKIAKTAIRHNRANLSSIIKLIKITREKIELVEDPLIKQYLTEIRNHLEMLYNGIKNYEADFNEIINEELKEQNILQVEISDILDEIERKNKKVQELEIHAADNEQLVETLRSQIRDKEAELSRKVSSLPFGVGSLLTNFDHNNFGHVNNFNLGGDLITHSDLNLGNFKLNTSEAADE